MAFDPKTLAARTRTIPPFIVMDVIDRAVEMQKAGEDVIMLAVGEPDFPTPACIVAAAERALARNKTKYTHSLGIPPLREAIAEDYRRRYQVRVSPEQIIVTPGTSPAMFLVFSGLLDPGDEMILSDPGYPCYKNMIEYLGGRAVRVPVREEDGFQYRPQMIQEKISPRTKAVIINSPGNPTGNLLEPERMAEIARLGPLIISDEIYHGLVYAGREHSVLEFTDRAVVLNGFSKRYSMTGWRVGYAILPPEMVRPLQKVQQNFFISTGDFVQWAAIAALQEAEPEVEQMRRTFDQRRRLLIQGLRSLGFGITVEPTGAFYVLANAKNFSADSYRLAFDILLQAKVGVAPGIDFGPNTEGYLRFSYAASQAQIEEGLRRIGRYLETLTPRP
jgi:(5-formylfuran-3-yl)methyl phosphate transaminase